MKIALGILATLGTLLVLLLVTASADSEFLASYTVMLIGLNSLTAMILLLLVAAQIRRLFRQYRQGVFGARLKSRLLLTLILMAVVPGVLVYAVSMQFAVRSIDSWFDVRVEAALEGGLNLGRGVLDVMQADLLNKGRSMAYELAGSETPPAVLINQLREQTGVNRVTLLSASGQLLTNSSAVLGELLPTLPEAAILRKARSGSGIARVDEEAGKGLVIRALVPVGNYGPGIEPRILQLEEIVPKTIVQSASAVESAYREYREIQLGRAGLKGMYTLTLTFALLLALFAAIALAFFLASRLAKPLLMLAEGTRAVAAGDLTPRANFESHDELGVLVSSFNEMTAQLAQARIDREAAQRAAVWGEVARRLAHEIRNPLTPIQLSAERLQAKLADKLSADDAAMLQRATRTIVGQVEAMKSMVNDFRDYARMPSPLPSAMDLNTLIREILELYQEAAATIETDLAPDLPQILADSDQMRQVMHNLLKNASEALLETPSAPAGAERAARIMIRTTRQEKMVALCVADNGPGFPEEVLAHACDPYVTTKVKGTGLGLAIVMKIADDHGGKVRISNRPAGGAEVTLLLPVYQQ